MRMIPTARGSLFMGQVCLVSGPPGCGKTTWVLETLRKHQGPCAFLRLEGDRSEGLAQGVDGGIDPAWLKDQIPELIPLQPSASEEELRHDGQLTLIEVQQFRAPETQGLDGYAASIRERLDALNLQPDQILHFGRDSVLPTHDTLEFTKLEAWHVSLERCVWDLNSLSSFWFELVNGAYGDVYRAKGLMNLPDGRAFFCNWMVSQQESQFLPLNSVAPASGRPNSPSALVVQGKALDPGGIQSTIDDCLLSDDVFAMQQHQRQDQLPESSTQG